MNIKPHFPTDGLASLISHWSVNYLDNHLVFLVVISNNSSFVLFCITVCSQPRTSEKMILFPRISHGVLTNMALFPHEMYQHHRVYFSASRSLGEPNWTLGFKKNLVKSEFLQSSPCFSWALEFLTNSLFSLSSVYPVKTPGDREGCELSLPLIHHQLPKALPNISSPRNSLWRAGEGHRHCQQLEFHLEGLQGENSSTFIPGKREGVWGRAPSPHHQPERDVTTLCSPFLEFCWKNGSEILGWALSFSGFPIDWEFLGERADENGRSFMSKCLFNVYLMSKWWFWLGKWGFGTFKCSQNHGIPDWMGWKGP